MRDNVIHIRLGEELIGSSPTSSCLLNVLRYRMEMCEWRRKNREARPTEDPSTWDWEALSKLDLDYETVGPP